MPQVHTKYFGFLEYMPDNLYDFPAGIPGFEENKQFLFIDQPVTKPLVYMQSLTDPGLCFVALPILCVDPEYRLHIGPEDLKLLRCAADRQPRIGDEVLCLALLSLAEQQPPTVNMLAPVVVNLKTRTGLQAIQIDTEYSHKQEVPCS